MRSWTLVVSVCAHAVVVAAIFVSPILATTDLPAPRRPLTFEAITPVVVPTVPAPARPRVAESATAPQSIPITEPTALPIETTPIDTAPSVSDRCDDCGIVGGVIGSVVSGNDIAPPPPPAVSRPPVRVGGVVRPPSRISYVEPVYPPLAIASKKEGMVILEAIIDEQGSVREVRVLRSVHLLDDAAVRAVSKWRFTPTLLNGSPVPVVMTVTVGFTLKR